jgi:LCP family protein required for cell wall assembly
MRSNRAQPRNDDGSGLAAPSAGYGLSAQGEDAEATQAGALGPEAHGGLTRADIEASLRDIDQEPKQKTKKKRGIFGGKRKRNKRIILAIIAIVLAVLLYAGIRFLVNAGNIFTGGLSGLVQAKELKKDENGLSNIVVFGTSEDHIENGEQHDAPYLTDSIMVVSIDQEAKKAHSFSIPRDLLVKYDGAACISGYQGKINEVFQCYSEQGVNEEEGADALRSKISEVTGLDIQYYAHVNYSVVRDAVNAVGGVEVVIESQDSRGILDRNFDWTCNYQCYKVKYPNGPTGTLDGDAALDLARARGASGTTYGLERGNYDRELNQQKILKALRDKAVSAGTLTNIGKITALMDAFGANLRTNFETGEVRTLMQLGNDIPADKISSISIIDAEPAILMNDNVNGASVVRPVQGFFEFSGLANYLIAQIKGETEEASEQAVVGVFNGSGASGIAQAEADKLSAEGYTVQTIDNAPSGSYQDVELYATSEENPKTKAKLEEFYGAKVRSGVAPVATTGLDFVIILGKAPGS